MDTPTSYYHTGGAGRQCTSATNHGMAGQNHPIPARHEVQAPKIISFGPGLPFMQKHGGKHTMRPSRSYSNITVVNHSMLWLLSYIPNNHANV